MTNTSPVLRSAHANPTTALSPTNSSGCLEISPFVVTVSFEILSFCAVAVNDTTSAQPGPAIVASTDCTPTKEATKTPASIPVNTSLEFISLYFIGELYKNSLYKMSLRYDHMQLFSFLYFALPDPNRPMTLLTIIPSVVDDPNSWNAGIKCTVRRAPSATSDPYSATCFSIFRSLLNGASSIPRIHIPKSQIMTFPATISGAEKATPKYIAVMIKSAFIILANICSNVLSLTM